VPDGIFSPDESLSRVLDLVVALGVLILLSPLVLILAVLIKLDSPGPVIFRQIRIGRDRRFDPANSRPPFRRERDLGGSPFVMFKFRTMRVSAEEGSGPVWAGKDDPRVTRVGRWLRKTRFDEIPQLWNVVRGDMAIVGPRPERPGFVSSLSRKLKEYPERHRVLPGITGLAQISQNPDQTIEDVESKLRYDLEYIRNRSVLTDLGIMLKTLPVMFSTIRGTRRS
jgi:lipopolysaccharide/colanic/teichoic acid biosynthesis glycosyltransferase